MKSLIYGIDGGDKRIFDYFDMPFYQQLKRSYKSIPLKEDLINRGWSEILTGAEGKDTGGFYVSPVLDGTAAMSMGFKLGSVRDSTGIPYVWDVLGCLCVQPGPRELGCEQCDKHELRVRVCLYVQPGSRELGCERRDGYEQNVSYCSCV